MPLGLFPFVMAKDRDFGLTCKVSRVKHYKTWTNEQLTTFDYYSI